MSPKLGSLRKRPTQSVLLALGGRVQLSSILRLCPSPNRPETMTELTVRNTWKSSCTVPFGHSARKQKRRSIHIGSFEVTVYGSHLWYSAAASIPIRGRAIIGRPRTRRRERKGLFGTLLIPLPAGAFSTLGHIAAHCWLQGLSSSSSITKACAAGARYDKVDRFRIGARRTGKKHRPCMYALVLFFPHYRACGELRVHFVLRNCTWKN